VRWILGWRENIQWTSNLTWNCEVGWAWELLSRLETPGQILGLKLGGNALGIILVLSDFWQARRRE